LFRLAEKALQSYNYNAVIYAYEVNGVIPGKKLTDKYRLPLLQGFKGLYLPP